MRKSNSFKVPEKYFDNIDVEILEKLKFKKNVFTFPQNYFENIDSEKINIKGTTTETLGFLGREEGIACQVSVTLSKYD